MVWLNPTEKGRLSLPGLPRGPCCRTSRQQLQQVYAACPAVAQVCHDLRTFSVRNCLRRGADIRCWPCPAEAAQVLKAAQAHSRAGMTALRPAQKPPARELKRPSQFNVQTRRRTKVCRKPLSHSLSELPGRLPSSTRTSASARIPKNSSYGAANEAVTRLILPGLLRSASYP
jgi:hypothetical protein